MAKKLYLIFLVAMLGVGKCVAHISKIDSLSNQLIKAKNDTNKVKKLLTIGVEISTNDPYKGLMFYKQALILSEKLEWKKGIAYAYNDISLIYNLLGNNDNALDYDFKSLKIKEEL